MRVSSFCSTYNPLSKLSVCFFHRSAAECNDAMATIGLQASHQLNCAFATRTCVDINKAHLNIRVEYLL